MDECAGIEKDDRSYLIFEFTLFYISGDTTNTILPKLLNKKSELEKNLTKVEKELEGIFLYMIICFEDLSTIFSFFLSFS